jgi:multicomponent Na+:H+ antiporter subunit G
MIALAAGFLVVGLFFHAVAALGVLRMPDFYTRLHAVGKAETLGVLCTLAAVALSTELGLVTVKVGFVALFLFLSNATSTHAIGRAALHTGVAPWQRPERRERG